jgi:hypothetical protein
MRTRHQGRGQGRRQCAGSLTGLNLVQPMQDGSSFCSMRSSWVGAVCAGDVATPASERPNAEEAAEKRKDAQVAREIVLALPANAALTDEDRIGLVRPSRARRQTGVRRDRPPARDAGARSRSVTDRLSSGRRRHGPHCAQTAQSNS